MFVLIGEYIGSVEKRLGQRLPHFLHLECRPRLSVLQTMVRLQSPRLHLLSAFHDSVPVSSLGVVVLDQHATKRVSHEARTHTPFL